MLRIAIQGKLSEGTKFIELIRNNSDCILSGLCTKTDNQLIKQEKLIDHPVPIFDNINDLCLISDAIIFLNHSESGVDEVKQALRKSKHVFIHPQDILNPEILREYHNLAEEAGVLFYIFHKPIKKDLEDHIQNFSGYPEFIDIYRYAIEPEENKPADLNKLILQEILFLTSVNQQAIKNFKIVSVPYCSEEPYFVNLRIDFANSNSANLTINKFSGVDSRFSEIYFNHRMLRVNTLEKDIRVFHRNKQETDAFPLKTTLQDEFDPGGDIERFIKKLRASEFPANSFESGINAHLISWEILKKVSPAHFEK